MNKAANRETAAARVGCMLAAAACIAATPAWAQVEPPGGGPLAEQQARLEVSTSRLPRIEGLESASRGPRLNLAVMPQSRSAVGVALGMSGYAPPPTAGGLPGQTAVNFDVGLQVRHTTDSNYQVDISAWRRMNPQPEFSTTTLPLQQQATYVTRVELNLNRSAARGFVTDRGFLGLQLENGARIGLRRKDGGAMVYYRTKW